MRLQVAIHRHTFPPVNLVYNTTQATEPVHTVADLLNALNILVPLESSDGEWGLEDYLVEVAATSDQAKLYECLHYHFVKDVFREDDEVVIRALTSDEMRERRQGGRLQITTDGRHLFDGVAWGKRWRPHLHRPDISIPPRKRRRLLLPDSEDGYEDDEIYHLEYPPRTGPNGTIVHDEDEDYIDEYAEDDENDEDSQGVEVSTDLASGEKRVRIIVPKRKAEEDEDDSSVSSEEDDELSQEAGEMDEDELEFLLREAAELQKADKQALEESAINSSRRKRKRVAGAVENTDQDGHQDKRLSLHETDEPVVTVEGQIGEYPVVKVVQEQTLGNSGESPSEGISTLAAKVFTQTAKLGTVLEDVVSVNGTEHTTPNPATKTRSKVKQRLENGTRSPLTVPALPGLNTQTSKPDDDVTNSSGSASDNTGSDASTSDSEADSDANESSGSDSDSSSDSDSDEDYSSGSTDSNNTSSSSEEDDAEPKDKAHTANMSSVSAPEKNASTKPSTTTTSAPNKDNPPGSGSKRTKTNNFRVKQRKRLNNLKAQGLLDSNAGFEALRNFDATQTTSKPSVDEQTSANLTSDATELDHRRQEALARFNATNSGLDAEPVVLTPHTDGQEISEIAVLAAQPEESVIPSEMSPEEAPHVIVQTTDIRNEDSQSEEPSKRARLDVDSTRRMVFNSLGLRTPRTPDAEKALREKLSRQVPQGTVRESRRGSQPDQSATVNGVDASWKNKLIISAVECIQDGVLMTPPPFPFQQQWMKLVRANKEGHGSTLQEEGNASSKQQQSRPEVLNNNAIHDSRKSNIRSSNESKTISALTASGESIPIPDNFDRLPALSTSDLIKNTVIAYKQLHMNARFEPEESSYLVARIMGIQDDTIKLILSEKYRDHSTVQYDEETGDRIYGKFDVPDDDEDDDGHDDGYREINFDEMIQPKLVRASNVQVPASASHSFSNHGKENQQSQVVPDSAPESQAQAAKVVGPVEVDSSRRAEISGIIQDAGFDSQIDNQILQSNAEDPKDVADTSRQAPPSSRHSHRSGSEAGVANESHSRSAWSSSSFQPEEGLQLGTSPVHRNTADTVPDESSPPTVSLIETVDYPHVSQIDINHSSLPNASSSHQDAQRVSQNLPDIQPVSVLSSQIVPEGNNKDSQYLSLPSQVSESQIAQPLTTENIEQQLPMSLRGGETGNFDLDFDSESDVDSLPSLRALTQSQINQKSPFNRAHVSPPPLQKHLSSLDKGKAKALSPPPTSEQDPYWASSSPNRPPPIKASQNQASSLSQIPGEATVVDLTFSSPVEPSSSEGSDHEYLASGGSRRSKRIRTRTAKGQNISSFAGMGSPPSRNNTNNTRRSLLGRKARSQI